VAEAGSNLIVSGDKDLHRLKQYGKVNGAPAVALGLDLDIMRMCMSELCAGGSVAGDVYAFLFNPRRFELVLARLVRDLEGTPPRVEHLLYFFSRHDAWAKALPAEKACLLAACQPLRSLDSPDPQVGTRETADVLDFGEWVGLAVA